MVSKNSYLFVFSFSLIVLKSCSLELFVTPNRTCGKNCTGDIVKPYDNILFALQNASLTNSPTSIILLGNSSAEHYILRRELNQSNTSSLLYEFSNSTKVKFALQDIEIRPLFCDDTVVKTNLSLLDKCVNRNQTQTIVFKPMELRFLITKKISIQNVVFDWSESSQSVNSSSTCAQMRKRCCKTEDGQGSVQCNPKFYSSKAASLDSAYSLIELSSSNSKKTLYFDQVTLKSFRDKTLRSFLQTNGNGTFDLTFQNSTIDDVSFGQGIMYHVGTGVEISDSTVKLMNVNLKKYNYWNREEEPGFSTWSEGYLFWADKNFKGTISVTESSFIDLNAASAYSCGIDSLLSNYLKKYYMSRSDVWTRYNDRNSNKESSVIWINRFDGNLSIQDSKFQKIIGLYGSVIQIKDCSNSSIFTFRNNKFDNNFGMEGFANILIVTASKPTTEPAICPSIKVENCSFTKSKGCPGSYGNVGFICYWETTPSFYSGLTNSASVDLVYYRNKDTIFETPQINVSGSRFEDNLIPIVNSLAIVGSYFTYLSDNNFLGNGGTTAEIILYSLNGSNFLEKKPNQYYKNDPDWESNYASLYFGQSSAFFVDRLFKLQSYKNVFQGNWGPWEGSQVLGSSITIRSWIPVLAASLNFKDDIFKDHSGIPPHIAEKLVKYGAALKNNSYMPPLMTVSFDPKDGYKYYEKIDKPYIVFDGAEFRNNTLSFDVKQGCQYNSLQTERICNMMENNNRYLTGLIKFISETELREDGSIDFLALSQRKEISFSMMNSKIVENSLITEGCLFSTLWAENYFLNNLTIENNKINLFGLYFKESAEYSEPLLDLQLKNRNGIFCAYKRETIKGKMDGILFTATDLHVANNIGTIFNLYPLELNNFTIANSIFMNNSVSYSSLVNAFEASKVFSQNNLFIGSGNALGIFFLTSSNTFHACTSNIYLRNNGIHASMAYVHEKAQTIEISAKQYWNSIKPTFKTFRDKVTPQGGLYFLESAKFSSVLSEFKENVIYAGLIISLKSNVSFELSNITDHYVFGNSVIGNIYSSVLTMRKMKITNNSLSALPSFDNTLAIIILDKVKFNAEELEISKTSTLNQGNFLVGTKINGLIRDIKFNNFFTVNGAPLIRLDFSTLGVQDLVCNNISTLFKLYGTQLILQNVQIQSLRLSTSSRFLINMIDTVLEINKFEYLGGVEDSGNYFSLITGSNNNIQIAEAQFTNGVSGVSKIFELTNSDVFFIVRSKFSYDQNSAQTVIFDLSSSNNINIQECIFVLTGPIIKADNIFKDFQLVSNLILTNSHKENVEITGSSMTYLFDNQFLFQGLEEVKLVPESQIHFLNNVGLTRIQDNIFLSLLGSRGIIKLEGLTHPYNISARRNIFLNNTGVNGGAIHLDASLYKISTIKPTADIEDSIFLLNKALNLNGIKGKGGAIYQTTSSFTKQITRLKRNLYIKNSAETIGGALFFDYLPPQVDFESQFVENYANRPNHIGSYPVRLAYFEALPTETEPYLPNNPPLQQLLHLSNLDIIKWENIASGIQVNHTYIFGLVDMFGQIVYDDNSSSLELYPQGYSKETRHYFTSKVSVEAKNGLYLLDSFKFSYKIDEYYSVKFTSSAIQDQKKIPLDAPIISTSSLKVEVHFRNCSRGEIALTEEDIEICTECQSGLWQIGLHQNALACKPCDDTSTICLGGDNVGPKKGYWRLNQTADIVHACPVSSSCLGNEITDQKNIPLLDPVGKCENGYKGNLCSNCLPGWAKTSSGSCTNCKKSIWFYTRVMLTLLLQLFLIIQGFRQTMNLCRDYSENKVVNLSGAILIRIITNYLQLISLVSAIPVTWPRLVIDIYEMIFQISSINQNIFTIECIFDSEELLGIKLVFCKLLLETTGSLILICLSLIFWMLYFAIKRKPIFGNRRFVNSILTTIIVICFMMQPLAIQSSFSFFKCTNLYREDTPIQYFSRDYDIKCWEGAHLHWTLGLGVPALVIWSFLLPFLVFNQIRKNKTKLNKLEISEKYSFLYGGYTPSKYYWELVIMVRKLIFIGVIIGTSFHSTNLEVYVSIFLVGLFYFIQSIGSPFADPRLNSLEKISLLSALTINFCGLYFQFFISTSLWLDYVIIAIGLLSNLIFLGVFIRLYLIMQIQKLNKAGRVYRNLARISKKFSCCLSYIEPKKVLKIEIPENSKLTNRFSPLSQLESVSARTKPESPERNSYRKPISRPRHTTRDCSLFEDFDTNREKDEKDGNRQLITSNNFKRIKQYMPLQSISSRIASPKSSTSPKSYNMVLNKPFSNLDVYSCEGAESSPDFDDAPIDKGRDENNDDLIFNLGRSSRRKRNNLKNQRISSRNSV